MMQIIFSGVGEAFDETLSNTSLIVITMGSQKKQVLLDCGFTAAHAFWRHSPNPMELDAVWVSHFHGDHFLGLPLLLLRLWEEKRTRPINIIGQPGIEKKISTAMELAYPGFASKLKFEIIYSEIREGQKLHRLGLDWAVAPGHHSRRCLGVRLDSENGSLYYSGDGRPSEETESLARDCQLVIHEAYGLEQMLDAHGSVDDCIEFARKTGARHLALVHMNRQVRQASAQIVRARLESISDFHAFLPEPGEALTIGDKSE